MQQVGFRIAKDFIAIGNAKCDQLDDKVRLLLDDMHATAKALQMTREVSVVLEQAAQEKVLDFSEKPEFRKGIDELHELGILKGDKKYKFNKKELELLKHQIDNYEKTQERKNQQSMLLIQPLLGLMKQIVDILSEAMKDENSLIEHAIQRMGS